MLFEVVLRIFFIIILLFFSFIRDFDGKENFFFLCLKKVEILFSFLFFIVKNKRKCTEEIGFPLWSFHRDDVFVR